MAGELTRFERRDEIAVIALDSPPVNALGAELVASLAERIAAAVGDPHIHAVVIHGDNGIFSGGADIRGFAKEHSGPTLRDAIAAIEDAQKPFIAALEGNALGGGLELALACDYRIALARAKLGQPEIALGLIPGAGGTQRLPRLVGLAAAVEMIVGGDPVSAERAKELGLVDAVVGRDLVEAAVTFAHSVRRRRKTSAMPVRGDAAILDAKRLTADRNDRGGLAVHLAIDAIEAAVRTPFDLALAFERELFERLRASEQSKARVHVFFAERAAAKVAGVPEVRTHLRKAAVIGGGTMGTGIAMTLANAGIEVMLIDVDGDALVRSRERIERNYDSSLRKHKLTHAQVEERHARIGYSAQLAAAASAEIVIEAVFEEMELKQEIFRALDRTINVDAILATNTSTLDVDAIAGVTRRPGEVVGTHFFSPANVMRLLEIVRGKYTEPETLGRTLAFARQIGKVPVVAGNCDGFIGNRMLAHYRREADFLLEEGATPQQVDRVIRDFGFPMGPFAMVDLAGLDVSWRIRKRRNAEKPPEGRYSTLQDRLCELGRFGQKTGAGFYKYIDGRTPMADPAVEQLIAEHAKSQGIAQRVIGDDEIRKRCIYPLINEAAKILAEGIAQRPGDVDVVWVYGYGFPIWRGGPLRYADATGIRTIYEEMLAFERVHGSHWTPAPLLAELATSGGEFAHWKGAQWAIPR